MQRYLKRAKELESEIVENRRKIHQFGGIGFDIQETSDFVFEKLQSYGLHPQRMCGTGIVCTIGSGGKTILLRADMDALHFNVGISTISTKSDSGLTPVHFIPAASYSAL